MARTGHGAHQTIARYVMTRQEPAGSEPTAAETAENESRKKRADQRDWADEAAKARTTDDPRRRSPHDSAGVPSSGDNR